MDQQTTETTTQTAEDEDLTKPPTVDDLIELAIADHDALIERKREQEATERAQAIRTQLDIVRATVQHHLTVSAQNALQLTYAYGHVRGWNSESGESAHALITVDGDTLPLITHPDPYWWAIHEADGTPLAFRKGEDGLTQRNLFLVLHYRRTGVKLYTD